MVCCPPISTAMIDIHEMVETDLLNCVYRHPRKSDRNRAEHPAPSPIAGECTEVPFSPSLSLSSYFPFQNSTNVRKSIKLVHTFSAGADGLIHEPYITDTNLPLTTSSGIHGPPISEYVLLNWLVNSKHYGSLYEAQKKHEWISRKYASVRQSDHAGKRVAILGYGSIGRSSQCLFFFSIPLMLWLMG